MRRRRLPVAPRKAIRQARIHWFRQSVDRLNYLIQLNCKLRSFQKSAYLRVIGYCVNISKEIWKNAIKQPFHLGVLHCESGIR